MDHLRIDDIVDKINELDLNSDDRFRYKRKKSLQDGNDKHDEKENSKRFL